MTRHAPPALFAPIARRLAALPAAVLLTALSACTLSTGGAGGAGGEAPSGAGADAAPAQGGAVGGEAQGGAGGGAVVDANCALSLPDSYDGSSYAANAAEVLAMHTRLKTLMDEMKLAEANLEVQAADVTLQAYFAEAIPVGEGTTDALSLSTFDAYASRIQGWLSVFADASTHQWTPAAPADGATGGVYGSWIFSPEGRDLRQAIEKGMLGATHFYLAALQAEEPMSAAVVDKILALYGAYPLLPRDDKHAEFPDRYTAQYAKRREDPAAGGGYYSDIKTALIIAQAAAAVGADCENTYRTALGTVLSTWERVLAGTVVYYISSASTKLSGGDETKYAEALHAIGEMGGFVGGLRGHSAASRIATDAELEAMLALLNIPVDGEETPYAFVTDAGTELSKLAQLKAELATVYGFTEAQLTAFETNF